LFACVSITVVTIHCISNSFILPVTVNKASAVVAGSAAVALSTKYQISSF
jgi:hypothetical protein